MTETRWDRLARDLQAAGFAQATVSKFRDSERIEFRIDANRFVAIRDTTWHDNWTGWQAWVENRDAIATRNLRKTKKRSEVVAFVKAVAA
jgi:hypothetical protein